MPVVKHVTDRTAILIACSISFVCSVCMLVCFATLKRWRNRPGGAKHVLLCLTIFDGIAAMNYFIPPFTNVFTCQLQATIMQYFETGAWVWTGVLSIELALHMRRIFEGPLVVDNRGIFAYRPRILMYHAVVQTYCIGTTVLIHALGIAGDAGDWCWVTSNLWAIQTYVTLWITFVIVFSSRAFILRSLREAEKQMEIRLSSGYIDAKAAKEQRRDSKLTRRMLIIPVAYVFLHIAGSLNRCSSLFHCADCSSTVVVYLQACCDPSQGTLNFLLYALMDTRLRKEAFLRIQRTSPRCAAFLLHVLKVCQLTRTPRRRRNRRGRRSRASRGSRGSKAAPKTRRTHNGSTAQADGAVDAMHKPEDAVIHEYSSPSLSGAKNATATTTTTTIMHNGSSGGDHRHPPLAAADTVAVTVQPSTQARNDQATPRTQDADQAAGNQDNHDGGYDGEGGDDDDDDSVSSSMVASSSDEEGSVSDGDYEVEVEIPRASGGALGGGANNDDGGGIVSALHQEPDTREQRRATLEMTSRKSSQSAAESGSTGQEVYMSAAELARDRAMHHSDSQTDTIACSSDNSDTLSVRTHTHSDLA